MRARACVCVSPWCKYVKHTQTANDSCHTPKQEEKRWRRSGISHLPAATSYPDETLHRLKKQKMLKFDQAHLRVGATEGRRGKVWREWHVSGSSALRVKSFTLKKKVWNGVTEESVDFGLVGFHLCKRIGKCVCAVLLIHFYFHSELSLLSVSQRKCFKRM